MYTWRGEGVRRRRFCLSPKPSQLKKRTIQEWVALLCKKTVVELPLRITKEGGIAPVDHITLPEAERPKRKRGSGAHLRRKKSEKQKIKTEFQD